MAAILLCAAASRRFCVAQPPSPGAISTAPTPTPEQLDRQWIAATARFAGERGRVLRSVDATAQASGQSADGLHIALPANPIGRYAYVCKIKLREGK